MEIPGWRSICRRRLSFSLVLNINYATAQILSWPLKRGLPFLRYLTSWFCYEKYINCTKFPRTTLHPLWEKPTTLRSLFFFINCNKIYLHRTLLHGYIHRRWITGYLTHVFYFLKPFSVTNIELYSRSVPWAKPMVSKSSTLKTRADTSTNLALRNLSKREIIFAEYKTFRHSGINT